MESRWWGGVCQHRQPQHCCSLALNSNLHRFSCLLLSALRISVMLQSTVQVFDTQALVPATRLLLLATYCGTPSSFPRSYSRLPNQPIHTHTLNWPGPNTHLPSTAPAGFFLRHSWKRGSKQWRGNGGANRPQSKPGERRCAQSPLRAHPSDPRLSDSGFFLLSVTSSVRYNSWPHTLIHDCTVQLRVERLEGSVPDLPRVQYLQYYCT